MDEIKFSVAKNISIFIKIFITFKNKLIALNEINYY